jgi:CTP:molybdopterin cytidylyltransferase MocA
MQEPRFLDDSWKADVTAEYASWKTGYQHAQDMTPSERYAATHQRYLAALEVAANTADDYADGLANLDLASIQAGTAKIQRAQQLIVNALAEMPNP